jgi:hypothetical protein
VSNDPIGLFIGAHFIASVATLFFANRLWLLVYLLAAIAECVLLYLLSPKDGSTAGAAAFVCFLMLLAAIVIFLIRAVIVSFRE